MGLCYPSTPKQRAMQVACFVFGVTLFAIGAHLSFVNVAPQQARIKARNEAIREIYEKREQARNELLRQRLERRERQK